MDNNYGRLRGVAFGGFNKQDVIGYIEKIKNEAYGEKKFAEKKLEEEKKKSAGLQEKLEQAENEITALNERIGELSIAVNTEKNDTVEEITEATNYLKSVADELCQSLRDFIEKITENSYSVVIEDAENKNTDELDSSKFIEELKAEIYSKLGVVEASAEGNPENEETEDILTKEYREEEEIIEKEPLRVKTDEKVSSILSSLSSFTDCASPEKKPEVTKDETVDNILGSLSFLK